MSRIARETLHTTEHERYGTRAFLRLELTEDAVVVVVHELGPVRVRADSQESRDEWQNWVAQLEPPALVDDVGTAYMLSAQRQAEGPGGSPSAVPIPMKATVSWYFVPVPGPDARRWTIDGRWTVERARA